MNIIKIFSRYPVYLLVGGGVTLVTVFLRSIIGLIINDQSEAEYIASMIIAYILGIILSLFAHKSITFKSEDKISVTQTYKFILTHLFGMVGTLIISVKLRQLILDSLIPVDFSKTIAFAIAAFIISLITYIIKKYLVFSHK